MSSIAALLMLITACTGDSSPDTAETTQADIADGDAEPAEEPAEDPVDLPEGVEALPEPPSDPDAVRGGILRDVDRSDPIFDPHTHTSHSLAPMFDSLVQAYSGDPEGVIYANLATAVDVSDDGLTYTFYLRDNALFHDGEALTADDVVFSLQRAAEPPEGKLSLFASRLTSMQEVESVDSRTVEVTLSRPDSAFVRGLSGIAILPEHLFTDGEPDQITVGTGPFRLAEHDPGITVVFERNEDYYAEDRPYLDGVEVQIFDDPSPMFAALRSQRLDVSGSYDIAPDQIEVARDTPGLELVEVEAWSVAAVYLHPEREPFDNPQVRKAIALALDQAFVRDTAQGIGTVNGLLPLLPQWNLPEEGLQAIPSYAPDIEARRAEARTLLEEAGASNLQITAICRDSGFLNRSALAVQQLLGEVGVDVSLNCLDRTTQRATEQDQDFTMNITIAQGPGYDPGLYIGELVLPDSGYNFTGHEYPGVQELFDRQAVETDVEARREIVWELEQAAIEEYVWIPLYHQTDIRADWDYVHRLVPATADILGVEWKRDLIWMEDAG